MGIFKKQPDWLIFLAILAFTAVIFLVFRFLAPEVYNAEASDYTFSYRPVAQNIVSGMGVTDQSGQLATKYPPGYPIVLAVVYWFAENSHIQASNLLSFVILLCSAISSYLLFVFARSLYGVVAAFIVVFLWGTYLPFVALVNQKGSEALFIPLLFFCILLFWHTLSKKQKYWPYFLAVGGVAGLCMLIRPIAIGVGLLLAVLTFLLSSGVTLKTRILFGCMILLGNLLVVLPWEATIYQNSGDIVLLSTNGLASIRDGLTFTEGQRKSYRAEIPVPQDVQELIDRLGVQIAQGTIEKFSDLAIVLKIARDAPLATLKFILIKAIRSWYATDSGMYERYLLLLQLPYLLLIVIGSVRVWHNRQYRSALCIIWAVVIYFWLMTILTLSILRYMVPAVGLLFLLGPAAFRQIPLLSPSRYQSRSV